MTCTKCDFDKQYELARDYTIIHDPDSDETETPEVVDALPKACPVSHVLFAGLTIHG